MASEALGLTSDIRCIYRVLRASETSASRVHRMLNVLRAVPVLAFRNVFSCCRTSLDLFPLTFERQNKRKKIILLEAFANPANVLGTFWQDSCKVMNEHSSSDVHRVFKVIFNNILKTWAFKKHRLTAELNVTRVLFQKLAPCFVNSWETRSSLNWVATQKRL